MESLENRLLLSAANVSQNPDGFESNEGAIAVNPRNPSRLFAAFNEYESGKIIGIGARFSTDGGTTWRNSDTTGLFPGIGDPAAAFDQFGNLFLAYATGPDQADMSFLVVAVSYNFGMSFARSVRFDSFAVDQPNIATGPAGISAPGQVVISWAEGNSSSDVIYARAAAIFDFGDVAEFGGAQQIPGSAGNYSRAAIGPDGTVMVGWQTTTEPDGPSTLYVATARPLLTLGFNRPIMVATSNIGFEYTLGDPGPLFRDKVGIDVVMNLAWDRSGGPHNGRVHVVYTEVGTPGSEITRIESRYSDDQGRTWSSEEFVSDFFGKSRFMPQLALDQMTGNIAAAWYDARNSADNTTVDIYYSVSTDGGRTWSANQILTDGNSDSHLSMNEINFGDYNSMDAYNGSFYPIWADNSSYLDPFPANLPQFDMATTRVSFAAPGAPSGMMMNHDGFPFVAQGILLGEIIRHGQGLETIDRFLSDDYFQRLNPPIRPNTEILSIPLSDIAQKSSLELFVSNQHVRPVILHANGSGHNFRGKIRIEREVVTAPSTKDDYFLSDL